MQKSSVMDKNNIVKISPLGFQWKTEDPFIFCIHHRDLFPKGNDILGPDASLEGRNIGNDFTVKDGWRMYHGDKVPGFPCHPHRGFETITIVKEGLVDHADSLGSAGRYGDGDVQWMTAGKGIQHSEMFPLINKEKDNPMELFQIWLNLPKANKFVEPYFKMLWKEDIPIVTDKDINGKSITINVIAGEINGVTAPNPTPDSWAAKQENQVAILTIKMEANATWVLPRSKSGANRNLYFYKGKNLKIEGETIPEYHSVKVNSDKDISIQTYDEECFVLMLQGTPINEPVVQYGPFVMNTEAEIRNAYEDYQQTKFGGWPWSKYDQTHDRLKERFALHADEDEEIKL